MVKCMSVFIPLFVVFVFISAVATTSEASLKCLSFSNVFTQSYTKIKLSELLSGSDRSKKGDFSGVLRWVPLLPLSL